MTTTPNLDWQPDLRLAGGKGGNLQEFVSHDGGAELRITLQSSQEAEIEVNGHIVAHANGFQNAAALAEIYCHDSGILLTEGAQQAFWRIVPEAAGYRVLSSEIPTDLRAGSESSHEVGLAGDLDAAISSVQSAVGGAIVPAFLDQREIYQGLGHRSPTAPLVAIWVARWHLMFTSVFANNAAMLSGLYVAMAPDGTYYTIYRLASGAYLTEARSRHEAETIGEFVVPEAARAYCALLNAARHSDDRVRLGRGPRAATLRTTDGRYTANIQPNGSVELFDNNETALGRFPSKLLAEAYVTAHRDMLKQFRLA